MKIFRFKSITMKIAVMVFTMSALLSLILIYAYSQAMKGLLVDFVQENSSLNAKRYSDVIEFWFNERIHDMNVYANNTAVENVDVSKANKYLKDVLEKDKTKYAMFFLVDSYGNYRTIDNLQFGSIQNNPDFSRVMKGESMISDLVLERAQGSIDVIVPIYGSNNSIVGALGGIINLSEVEKSIKDAQTKIFYNRNIFIIDNYGVLVQYLQRNLESNGYENAAGGMLNSKEGFIKFKNNNGEQYLYFFTMPNTEGWKIVSQVSAEELNKPLNAATWMFGILGTGAIIFATMLSIIVARTISRPIIKLQRLFNTAAAGDLSVRAEYKSKDEVGKAAESFNIMMDTLSKMTYYDAVTELPNLNFFNNQLDLEIKHRQVDKRKLGIMIISIDRFKKINNMFGYDIGDKLLKEIAGRISVGLKEVGVACRASGDEFMLFTSEINEEKDIVQVARKILKDIKKPWAIDEYEGYVSASIGVAIFPNDGKTSYELIKNAGIAKTRAKELSGDKYELYNQAINEALKEQLTLDNLLHNALEREEFIIYYQPLVCVSTGKIVGAEALIRWNSPELGMVSPAKFIPIVEANGLIIPIGEWVLKEACIRNRYWHSLGFSDMVVSVNVSAYQFEKEDFVESVERILKETQLEPQHLELEITEGLAMNNVEDKINKLNLLKKMGIKIAIDDFGTGYSSLSYLKRFPVDSLKIDQSFVKDIPENASSTAIASTIVSMGNNLKMEIIAEGVETREQFEFVKKEKCNLAQGYFFSKPIEAKQFEIILKEEICFS